MISVEDWAEIRRLHRSEGLSQAAIARHLGISRNTVAKALASSGPPRYSRPAKGSAVDAFEPAIRSLLVQFPRMPATVIAERVGWTRSMTVLKERVRQLRPLFVTPDPTDRVQYEAGQVAQCDLWFPPVPIPVGHGAQRVLPVLAMTCGYSRITGAVMIPSRRGGDILAGMWQVLTGWDGCPRMLVWDREAAIGGTGKASVEATSFVGTLGVRLRLAPARDPEFKGLVERRNGFFETSFLPGRTFTSPADFTAQISAWLPQRAATRRLRLLGGDRPVDRWDTDRAAMVRLPPLAPVVGLRHRTRLGRDYYVRLDSNDYSVDPRVIGRFVDVTATLDRVRATCSGQVVADHARCWGSGVTVTDPAHRERAKTLRADLATQRRKASQQAQTRVHTDGHVVAIRALPDYDVLFGVDFDPRGIPAPDQGPTTAEGM